MNKKYRLIMIICIISMLINGFNIATSIDNDINKNKKEYISFSTPELSEGNNYIRVKLTEATSILSCENKPELPVVTKTIIFPFGTKISNVKITFHSKEKIKLSKTPMISPPLHSNEIEHKFAILSDIKHDSSIPSNDYIYPKQQYSYRCGAGLVNNERVTIFTIHLYPICYELKNNQLIYSDHALIQLSYEEPRQIIMNPEIFDFLIITPNEFYQELEPLMDYKNNHNISTTMVTLDQIPNQGTDKQEDIKLYIKDAIETFGIKYVLLIGGGLEGQEIFPVRYAWVASGGHEDHFPCDLYYADIYNADVGFSSWDVNGDGKYAEYPTDMTEVDIYPDVYLGRLPCTSIEEVRIVVDKILDFEEHNKMMQSIVQIGGDTFIESDGDLSNVYEGELCNEAVIQKLPDYTTTKLWGSLETMSVSTIVKAFHDGVDFVDFNGHGNTISWSTHPPNSEEWIPTNSIGDNGFFTDHIIFLQNAKKLPVISLIGCKSCRFTDDTNVIGWAFVKKENGGSIATFGQLGLGQSDMGETAADRYIGLIPVLLFEGLYNHKILGKAWANMIANYANSFSFNWADYKVILITTLFGDPTLAIEDGPNPKKININELEKEKKDIKSKIYHGEIKVVNKGISEDYCNIPFYISTQENNLYIQNFKLLSWLLFKFPDMFSRYKSVV